MSDLLLDVPVHLSPRKQWERAMRIKTHHNKDLTPEQHPWMASRTLKDCFHACSNYGEQYSCTGETRDEAIQGLVSMSDLKIEPFETWRGRKNL